MGKFWVVGLMTAFFATAVWAEGRNDEFHAESLNNIIRMESELQALYVMEGIEQLDATRARLDSFRETILPLTEAPSFTRDAAKDAWDLIEVTAELVDERDDGNVVFGVGFLLETVRQIRGILEKPIRYQ